MKKCKVCGASIAVPGVPYLHLPPCDCCGRKGYGYLYNTTTGKSVCGACDYAGGKK
jgi:hypothetical protein